MKQSIDLQAVVCTHIMETNMVSLDNVFEWLDVGDMYDADIL